MGRRSRSRSDSPKRRKRERSRSRERHSRDKRRRESRKDRSRERDRNSTSRRWKEDSSSLSARRDSMRREERLKEEEAYRKRQEEKRKQLGGDMEEEEEKRGGQESKITDEELLKLQEKRKERLSRLEALTKGGQEQNEAAAPSNSGLSSLDLMKQFEAKLNRKSGNSLKTQGSSSSADFSKMDEPEVEKAPEKTKKRGMGLGGGLVLDSDSENENEALERHEDKTKFTRKELEADDDDRKGPGARGSKRPREEKSEKKEKEKEKEEDEVDPLDAFMSTINTEIKEIEQVDKVKAAKEKKRQQRMGERLFEEDNVPDEIRKSKDDDEKYVFDMLYKKKDLAVVDHSSMDYHDFKKAFYIETPEITRMTENEVKQLRNLLGKIKIKGKNCPRPIKLWTHAGLSLKVLQTINKLGYSLPTPIQAQALPAVMSGRDVIGIAKTGSGKTLAFLLPLLRHIMDQPPLGEGEGPMAIIMAPTRELATQIYNEAKKFTKVVGMRMCCAYGGAPISEQIADLKRGAEIVVCTPGRMIDLLCANQGRVTNLHRVTYLVLDEADRMFDMGFEPQIMRIINNIRPDRQTVMFSATFPRAVETLARKILKQPLEIIVGERSTVCDDITQVVDVVDEDRKWHKLLEVLGQWQHIESILVFVDRQESADTLCKQLLEAGYDKVNAIHGGKSQEQRDQILADYKNKKLAILIATSVAARGLHVKNLQLVINYNAPNHYEDYVHRVGRTGRAGNKGTAYTFLTEDEAALAADLVVALEYNKQEVRPAVKKLADDFKEKQKAGQARHHSGFGGKGFKFDEEEQAQQKKARDTLKKASGLEVEEEEEEEEGEDVIVNTVSGAPVAEGVIRRVNNKSTAAAASSASAQAAQNVINTLSKKPESQLTPQEKAQLISARLELQKNLTESAKMDAQAALDAAARIAASITNKLAEMGAEGLEGEHYEVELEINDYPQQARWKASNRDHLYEIEERTGAAITQRGVFIPPGRKPKDGERKLFLFIESDSLDAVKDARTEIKRELAEETLRLVQMGKVRPEQYAKYSVL